MDSFGFSLLPAAARAGLDTITLSRHVPLFRRDVGRHDTTVALAQCSEPNRFLPGELVLLLTRRRIVVTRRRRLPDRVRPHLSAEFSELSDVDWRRRDRMALIDLAFRLDGRPHRLWVRSARPGQVAALTAAFQQAFPRRAEPSRVG